MSNESNSARDEKNKLAKDSRRVGYFVPLLMFLAVFYVRFCVQFSGPKERRECKKCSSIKVLGNLFGE